MASVQLTAPPTIDELIRLYEKEIQTLGKQWIQEMYDQALIIERVPDQSIQSWKNMLLYEKQASDSTDEQIDRILSFAPRQIQTPSDVSNLPLHRLLWVYIYSCESTAYHKMTYWVECAFTPPLVALVLKNILGLSNPVLIANHYRGTYTELETELKKIQVNYKFEVDALFLIHVLKDLYKTNYTLVS